MYKFQTLNKEELENIILCAADRISCSYCPCKEECIKDPIAKCEKIIFNYLFKEVPDEKYISRYDAYNEGFKSGYDTCKRDIINKLQKGRKENENSRQNL